MAGGASSAASPYSGAVYPPSKTRARPPPSVAESALVALSAISATSAVALLRARRSPVAAAAAMAATALVAGALRLEWRGRRSVLATLNYMSDCVRPSLRRNGRVYTRRDQDGSDAPMVGVHWDRRPIAVEDGRGHGLRLGTHGFELIHAPLASHPDYYDTDAVVCRAYKQCEAIVREATGATFVKAFDHNVRCRGGQAGQRRLKSGGLVQAPLDVVHGDYTLTSAPRRLSNLTEPPKVNDTCRRSAAPIV